MPHLYFDDSPHAVRLTPAEWAAGWGQDITRATRSLARAPGFVLAVVLTLALGLGTNAAIFSFLDQVFLRAPAGVTSPQQLRRLWLQRPAGISKTLEARATLAYHEYQSVAAAIADQALLALYTTQTGARIGRGDVPATTTIAYVTTSYFSALGVRPSTGRVFTEREADVHGAIPVVVVSNAFWRTRLGGSATAIGKTVTVNDIDYTIIGILPAGFTGIELEETHLWLPLGMFPQRQTARVSFWDSSVIPFSVFGRVLPGANERLVEDRASSAIRFAPVTDFAPSPSSQILLRSINKAQGPDAKPPELSIAIRLAFVAIIVLLVAAANVVNLLLVRASARQRESAIRLALGCSRARLARLFVIESTILALVAGVAAIGSAQITGGLLRALLLPGTHFANGPVGLRVILFTIALALVTGIIAGLISAVQATKAEAASDSLRIGTRTAGVGRSLLPRVLVAAQSALSVALLVCAVLFVRSLRNIQNLSIGFDVPRLAYASVALPRGESADTLAFAANMRAVADRVRGTSGIETVAFAFDEPMTWFRSMRFYTATDSSDAPDKPVTTGNVVSSDFFKAIGVSFSRGATFSDQAGGSASSVVVNETLARTFWPGRDPIGQCIFVQTRDAPCLSVAGVVQDAIRQQLTEERAPQLYLPLFGSLRGQRSPNVMVIRAEPSALPAAMTHVAHALHEAFPRGEPRVVRVADRLEPQYRPWRLGAALFSVFGILALLVAALGIYSSVSYTVTQRSQELGVRIALGATMEDVMRHVVGRGVKPVIVGAILGSVLAVAGGRLTSSLLYGIEPWNPGVIVAVVFALVFVGTVAASIPGWRATRIDPLRAMTDD